MDINNEKESSTSLDQDIDNYDETINEPQFLLQIVGLTQATVIHYPSYTLPEPVVLDLYSSELNDIILGYSPSGDCDGILTPSTEVYVMKSLTTGAHAHAQDNTSTTPHVQCSHNVFLAIVNEIYRQEHHEQIMCVYPKIANEIVENAIEKNYIYILQNVKQLKRHVPIALLDKVNSNFDFCGICDDDVPFLMKVTNVTDAKYKGSEETDEYESKVAYYPGRNTIESAERMKMLTDLITIKRESIIRGILCFVIERTDVEYFQINANDQVYTNLIKEALAVGIVIITIMVNWNTDGVAYFIKDDTPILDF
jgi:DNA-binding sugar fermentation-stimulating protein